MTAVSIIVPMYNVDKYLVRCLGALAGQTLKDIEVICIDDGSPDRCAEICAEYAARDDRFTLIRQENGGAGAARNAGLRVAKGEYLGFVDPDDSVDPDFFEKLYSRAILTGADIVKGQKYQIITSEAISKLVEPIYKNISKIPMFTANKRIKKNRGHFNYTFWQAIYKREFIVKNGIDFPVGLVTGQDTVFLTKAVCLANKLEFVNGAYYNYFRHADSADSKILSGAKAAAKIDAANIDVDFINGADIAPEVYGAIFKKKLRILLRKTFSRCNDADMRKALAESAVKLYEKCKHPQSCRIREYDKYLSNGDAEGLHKYLEKRYTLERSAF